MRRKTRKFSIKIRKVEVKTKESLIYIDSFKLLSLFSEVILIMGFSEIIFIQMKTKYMNLLLSSSHWSNVNILFLSFHRVDR